jgi:hypothetical protein
VRSRAFMGGSYRPASQKSLPIIAIYSTTS